MKRSPLDLAAVATAAVPGLVAAQVGRFPDDAEDFDAALVVDDKGNRWRVRSPKHPDASLRLETELRALGGLSPSVRATLPFAVPTVAGTVKQGNLKTFVYHHLEGHVLSLDELLASTDVATQVGRGIAAVHEIDRDTVERAGLPSYDAEEFRRARLSELDQVAASGKVPQRLLRRWENAMEDISLWRFNPSAVHGDLHEEQMHVHEGRLVAVTGWSDLHVGDPAEDLAWLLALDDQGTIDAVVEAYSMRRGDKADPHLMRRATLAAEFALARWLARSLTRGDAERVAEAEGMLADLDENLRELGDRPVGLVEAGPSAPAAEATAHSGESPEPAPAQEAAPAAAEVTAPVTMLADATDEEDEEEEETTPAAEAAAEGAASEDSASGDTAEGEPDSREATRADASDTGALEAAGATDADPDAAEPDDDADAVITDADAAAAAEPPTEALPLIHEKDRPDE